MEAYTLQWNGGFVKKFWGTNSRVLEAIENQYIFMESHMTILELEKILAFRSKRTKLALSLIIIMDHVHKGKVLHNDSSLSNILLHFPPNYVDRVYIGICD
jgi:hypothetical protein